MAKLTFRQRGWVAEGIGYTASFLIIWVVLDWKTAAGSVAAAFVITRVVSWLI